MNEEPITEYDLLGLEEFLIEMKYVGCPLNHDKSVQVYKWEPKNFGDRAANKLTQTTLRKAKAEMDKLKQRERRLNNA